MPLELLPLRRGILIIEPIFEVLSRLSSLRASNTLPRRRAWPVVREKFTLRVLILTILFRWIAFLIKLSHLSLIDKNLPSIIFGRFLVVANSVRALVFALAFAWFVVLNAAI